MMLRKRQFLRAFTLAASGLFVPRIIAADPLLLRRLSYPPPKPRAVSTGETLREDLTAGASNNNGSKVGSLAIYGTAGNFTASSSYTLSKIGLLLQRVGTIGAQVIKCSLYSNAAGSPNAEIVASDNSFNFGSISTTATEYEFTFTSGSVVSGTAYWIYVWSDILNNDTNFISARYWDNVAAGAAIKQWNGAAPWVNYDTTGRILARVYGI